MTPADLRELAAHHDSVAQSLSKCAGLMVPCPKAREISDRAQWHATKSDQLTELAEAFYAFAAHQ